MRYLAIVLVLASLAACRKDRPPVFDYICTLDGAGGADCVRANGEREYLLPSQTKNMWATTQADMSRFSAWCYDVEQKTAEAELESVRDKINGVTPPYEYTP